MKGLRLTIAKQTVSSILDTLGDDDFFNIIAVSISSFFFLIKLFFFHLYTHKDMLELRVACNTAQL